MHLTGKPHETTLIKWGNPRHPLIPFQQQAGPVIVGAAGRRVKGRYNTDQFSFFLLLLITSTERPRRMSFLLDLSKPDLHTNWGDAATRGRRCPHKCQHRWTSAGLTLSRHILRR